MKSTENISFFKSPEGKRIAMWLAFFLYWGGSAAFMAYIALYYESVNLSGRQIGQLTSIPFFISLVSSVVFGFLSDTSRRNHLLLRITTVGLICVLLVFPRAQTFWLLFPTALIYSVFQAPANPILDDTTLNALEKPENYGKVRMGGSIGWGLVVLLTGVLIDNLGFGIPVIFYINIAFLLIFFLLIGLIPSPKKAAAENVEKPTLKTLRKMLINPGVLLLFVVIIIWGMGEASISNFLFLHIKQLGGSSTLMGAALSISLVGEIVTFNFANRIQKKIGEFRMVLLAFVVLIIWLSGLSLIKDPNLIPAFQIFGGAGFALIQSGSVAYINRKAPRELGATAQALRGGLYAGLGVGVGTIISGVLYEFFGSSMMYRIMVVIQICGLIFGVFVYLRDHRNRTSKTGS
jgi:MFS transporter, PPP family, 3-phenylpropionic acid transporter